MIKSILMGIDSMNENEERKKLCCFCCCCQPLNDLGTHFQVEILLRELCRLHNVPLPSEVDRLLLPPHAEIVKDLCAQHQIDQHQAAVDDSDADEIEDATLGKENCFFGHCIDVFIIVTKTGSFRLLSESEPESEADEDLSLEMDDGRNANKVSIS